MTRHVRIKATGACAAWPVVFPGRRWSDSLGAVGPFHRAVTVSRAAHQLSIVNTRTCVDWMGTPNSEVALQPDQTNRATYNTGGYLSQLEHHSYLNLI